MKIVSKFGLLLAIIGFFMPVACDKNAFQLIEYVDKTSGALIIMLFILAFFGLIIGILLLMKKNVPIGIDWIIILACLGVGIGLLSKNELELQYGAYVIITGFCISFVFLLIASFINEEQISENIKKCPFCANEIKMEAIVCQFCGKDLPKLENTLSTESGKIENEYKAKVTQKTNIIKDPDEDQINLGVINKDEIITVIRSKNNWSCFIQDNGREAWINSTVLTKI